MRAGEGMRGHPFPRHVWVNVTGRPTDTKPGVLVDWRKSDRGTWEALVVWADGGGMMTTRAQLGWVLAEHVRPR